MGWIVNLWQAKKKVRSLGKDRTFHTLTAVIVTTDCPFWGFNRNLILKQLTFDL